MNIQVNINLSAPEVNNLTAILQCSQKDLPNIITLYATAASREYIDMIIGQKVFKRGSDILEYRLFLMIEEVFNNLIPDENKVSNLFQTTATESRSLIRSILSKYQYKLKVAIEMSLKNIIESATQESTDADYTVVINSQNLVDELNQMLAKIDGNLPLVSKQRGSVSTFVIKPSSYKKLKGTLPKDK
ncbi:MAG: hypothetical protein Q8L41_03105 [Anaerolineales bacterium]|nr:hypothetical protein [Anaerolineales bacterium]